MDRCAIKEVREVLLGHIVRLEAAMIKEEKKGVVYVWKLYWLGAQFQPDGSVYPVAVDEATVTSTNQYVTNRSGVVAVPMDRQEALLGAIEHYRMLLAAIDTL
jgi:hypothetical protein